VIEEFKEFINRGNFVDLAVGFVMGVAVSGVVNALVDRLIMPAIAVVIGQPSFDSIGTFGENGSLGAVLTALVNFFLVALALFLIVKLYNRMQRARTEEAEPEADPEDVLLLREIRDLLAAGAPTTATSPASPGGAVVDGPTSGPPAGDDRGPATP
jgi:large conductance mechanosensitive channel